MGIVETLCPPALIFLVFSIIQILIDIFKAYYNQAFFKFISMIILTLLLNILCKKGLGIISWLLVFIPFILMTFISVILLVVFGINPAEGDYTVNVDDEDDSNNDDDDTNNDDDTNDDTNEDTNDDTNEDSKKVVVVDPRTNKKTIYISNDVTVNDNENDNEDSKEGLLNYSTYNSSTNYKRRGYNQKDNQEQTKLETTTADTFYKNMFKKLI